MKKFGVLLRESLKEYKSNFKVFLMIFLLFYGIPRFLFSFMKAPNFQQIFLTRDLSPLYTNQGIIFMIISLFLSILALFMIASFIYNAVYRKKEMDFKETLDGGKKYFIKYFLFFIVHGFLLGLLYLIFMIPGIFFHISWIFAAYILIGENKGIIESLKKSFNVVKGKWWRTFGFALLFLLVVILIWIGLSLISSLINILISLPFVMKTGSLTQAMSSSVPNYLNIMMGLVTTLFTLGAKLIITPICILFFKNFYLDCKK